MCAFVQIVLQTLSFFHSKWWLYGAFRIWQEKKFPFPYVNKLKAYNILYIVKAKIQTTEEK